MVADGNEFVGVAKCDSKDKFNELIGMEIAKQKACIKYADYKQTEMLADLKSVNTAMEELERLRGLIVKSIKRKNGFVYYFICCRNRKTYYQFRKI